MKQRKCSICDYVLLEGDIENGDCCLIVGPFRPCNTCGYTFFKKSKEESPCCSKLIYVQCLKCYVHKQHESHKKSCRMSLRMHAIP